MAITSTGFHSQQAPCGQTVAGEHHQDRDDFGDITDHWYYDCGCRTVRDEYADGSICHKVVRHDGMVLEDELIAEHHP
jgi:hypothetical protein